MSQSRENLRTDGRTDGQTLFYRTLPAEAGVQQPSHAIEVGITNQEQLVLSLAMTKRSHLSTLVRCESPCEKFKVKA